MYSFTAFIECTLKYILVDINFCAMKKYFVFAYFFFFPMSSFSYMSAVTYPSVIRHISKSPLLGHCF